MPRGRKDQGAAVAPVPARDADVSESGTFSLRRAMWDSINTVYAPLAVKLGLEKVIALAHNAGMDIGPINHLAPHVPYPSYSLGVPTNPLGEAVCAENPHEYYNNKDSDVPKADKPDF